VECQSLGCDPRTEWPYCVRPSKGATEGPLKIATSTAVEIGAPSAGQMRDLRLLLLLTNRKMV
jgi:hypothetical protein